MPFKFIHIISDILYYFRQLYVNLQLYPKLLYLIYQKINEMQVNTKMLILERKKSIYEKGENSVKIQLNFRKLDRKQQNEAKVSSIEIIKI